MVDTSHLTQLLDATLDAQQHRKAENALKQEEKKPNYCLTLLSIVATETLPAKTRLAAALAFKNFIRLNYVDEEGNYKLPFDEVKTIKQEIVTLMISSSHNIQVQLGDSISIIADSDFWKKWDTLIQDLVSRLSPIDFKVTNGVLEVAHSIFVRWRPLFRSNDLYEEINHVVQHFGEPFIQMMSMTDQKIDQEKGNLTQLKGWFETLSLLTKIFFDLSCQDMPPVIESNLPAITGLFLKYLSYSTDAFGNDDDEPTPVEIVKADICEVLQLYISKYDEDFGAYAPPFTDTVWNLLSTVGTGKRYDLLVTKALNFLTAVASVHRHAQNFNNEAVLGQIVEKVILPNIALQESDIEMFEDEPIEFIRRDLEGSDTDSRRRAATDFLRKLLEQFETLVTQVVFRYIEHYLGLGKTDWKAKDTAVYLFLAIAATGSITAAKGVQTVNKEVRVVDFFETHIAADLLPENNVEPILKVDAIKYLHNFRSQLTKDQWRTALRPLIQNMASTNYVVYTYAAIAVERVLYLTDGQGNHMFSREDIEPFAKDLLEHLFQLIERDSSPAKLQENEFLMRCIMRVLIVIKDGVVPIVDVILDHLVQTTNIIKANPSNPRFYYYHFEAIGALVRFCAAKPGSPVGPRLGLLFADILTEDIPEFLPYVFQIMACLLESIPASSNVDHYKCLLKPLLLPTVWETRGNVPGLVRFMSAIIQKASDSILAEGQLEPILGVFQKLIASKKTQQFAFEILEALVASLQPAVLEPYFGTILTLLFTKLQADPADSFKQAFVRFYHLVSAKGREAGLGADFFIKHADALQSGVFTPIYLNIILPTTGHFARPVDRKLGVISHTKTLCDSEAFAQRYQKGWGFTCNNLLDLLKNPPKVAAGMGDDIINEADVDDIGFGIGFTPLNTCKRGPSDFFPDVSDVSSWVSAFLKEANTRHGGAITGFASSRLQPEAQQALVPFLQ